MTDVMPVFTLPIHYNEPHGLLQKSGRLGALFSPAVLNLDYRCAGIAEFIPRSGSDPRVTGRKPSRWDRHHEAISRCKMVVALAERWGIRGAPNAAWAI